MRAEQWGGTIPVLGLPVHSSFGIFSSDRSPWGVPSGSLSPRNSHPFYLGRGLGSPIRESHVIPYFSLPMPSSTIQLGSINQLPYPGSPQSWHENPVSLTEDGVWIRLSSKPPVW